MTAEPKRRGGTRPGAGRKPANRVKRTVSLPPEVWALIEAYRVRHGIATTGEAVERLALVALATTERRTA